MPQFKTRHFGIIDYPADAVFLFPSGLPGFEQETRFVAIEHNGSKPILFLQSLNRPDLCFITLPALAVDRSYQLEISAEDLRALSLDETRQPEIGVDVLCLAIVSVHEAGEPTLNLRAPIVANLTTRVALQAILETDRYSHQHPLPETKSEPAAATEAPVEAGVRC